MSTLVPIDTFSTPLGYDANTVALGGAGSAPMNVPLQALANRTEWTKNQLALKATPADIAAAVALFADPNQGDELIAVRQPLVGAEARTQHEKNRDIKSFSDFCPTGETFATLSTVEAYAVVTAAWNSALATPHDLVNWGETIDIGVESFPWRQQIAVGLLDCKNVTIYGTGPTSIFKTSSVDGADVFQLNGVKNLHFRNLAITATISGSAAGSNGISITAGGDNITGDSIWMENLPSLDKTSYVDGGKALTIQSSTSPQELGFIRFTNIYAKGCAEGFGYEPDLVTSLTKKTDIEIDNLVAEDCFFAVKAGSGEATGALSAGMYSGLKVRATAINCQKDLILNRVHGTDIEVVVITTKTEAARRLSPSAVAWFAADTIVESLLCAYAKRSRIVVRGNKGACAYKARIGGTTAGSSGLGGRTEFCDILLDIGGTASIADVLEIDSGGNTIGDSRLQVSLVTATSLPTAFYAASLLNTLTIGQADRLVTPKVSGVLSLAQGSDGTTETGRIDMNGVITRVQGKGSASAGAVIAGFYDNGGTIQLGIVNGGGIVIPAVGSGSALGAYIGKHPIYDASGALLGWFPIYG